MDRVERAGTRGGKKDTVNIEFPVVYRYVSLITKEQMRIHIYNILYKIYVWMYIDVDELKYNANTINSVFGNQ